MALRKNAAVWFRSQVLQQVSVLKFKLTRILRWEDSLTRWKHGRFITVFTTAHHSCLSWATWTENITSHPTAGRSILILSFHVSLRLRNRLSPSYLLTKLLSAFYQITSATCRVSSCWLELVTWLSIEDTNYII
jgi:hypothetical protein